MIQEHPNRSLGQVLASVEIVNPQFIEGKR